MTDAVAEGLRVLGLIVLVWFGLIGWKLIPLCRKSQPINPTLGDH